PVSAAGRGLALQRSLRGTAVAAVRSLALASGQRGATRAVARGSAVMLAGLLAAALAAPAAALPAPPRLSAPAPALFQAPTAQPLCGRAAGERRLIASTTKLMTVLVARKALPLGRVCVAPPYAAGPLESQIGLRAGERMSVHDLLIAAMLPSANDAANALAVC